MEHINYMLGWQQLLTEKGFGIFVERCELEAANCLTHRWPARDTSGDGEREEGREEGDAEGEQRDRVCMRCRAARVGWTARERDKAAARLAKRRCVGHEARRALWRGGLGA